MSPYTMKRQTTLLSAMSFPLNLSTFICPGDRPQAKYNLLPGFNGENMGETNEIKGSTSPKEKQVFPASSAGRIRFIPCSKPNVVKATAGNGSMRLRPSPDRRVQHQIAGSAKLDPVPQLFRLPYFLGLCGFEAICRPGVNARGRQTAKPQAPPK